MFQPRHEVAQTAAVRVVQVFSSQSKYSGNPSLSGAHVNGSKEEKKQLRIYSLREQVSSDSQLTAVLTVTFPESGTV